MAKYTKRNDGRYVAKIMINGKPKYLYAKTEKELDKIVTQHKYEYDKGLLVNTQNMTFHDLTEKWFDSKQRNKEYNTQIAVRRKLKNHIYPAIGDMLIKNIKSYNIQDLINGLISKGYTDTTTKVYQHISSILQFGVDNDMLIKNVAATVELPRFKTKPKEALTKQEREIVEKVAETHKHGDMIMTFMYTGMRREELIPLSSSQIGNTILVDRAICFQHNQPVLKSTKNGESRNIPILNKISRIIERRKNQPLLFPMHNGQMMSETSFREAIDSFRKACDKYCDEHNLPRFNFTAHILRHTLCTLLYEAGIPLKDAQEIMGHKSSKVTLDIYTHLSKNSLSNSKEKLDNFLTTF